MPAEVSPQDLRQAIARNELRLEYQPTVSIDTKEPIGFEALVRWQHPRLGLLTPDRFIPMAEETEVIVPMGAWVLRTACKQVAKWGNDLTIAVNVSPVQLANGLIPAVEEALAESRLQGTRLWLEVTETTLTHDPVRADAILRKLLGRYGVSTAIDDFGTGYSSLLYLRQFPSQQLKIDKAFVDRVDLSRQDAGLVRVQIDLAHNLGLEALAEGVERSEQHGALLALGCDVGQGYLWGKPMPPKVVELYLLDPDNGGRT